MIEIKVGDMVICKSWTKPPKNAPSDWPGAGFSPKKVFKVWEISAPSQYHILWPGEGQRGIYAAAVKKYLTPEEKVFNKLKSEVKADLEKDKK